MILNYTKKDEDLKFLAYYLDRNVILSLSKTLTLEIDTVVYENIDTIISKFYELANEPFDSKKLAAFKHLRNEPFQIKGDICVNLIINYINLVKNMITCGTLKDKDYIDQITKKININFDPDFYLLEMKVGKIISIEEAEGLDKIYSEKVLIDKEYSICSGLRYVYKKEELLNNKYLFLINIKKTKLKEYESEGMICCASSYKIEALKVEAEENTGLTLEGQFPMFKDEIFEKIDLKKQKYKNSLSEFKIIDHVLCFKGKKVLCQGEYVKTAIENAIIS